jgi:hypothetical protein
MADITSRPRLGLFHAALVGAATLLVLYVLCWAGAALGLAQASHLYLALFTTAPITSTTALLQGACLSIGFGLLVGALVALFFNLFRFTASA